MLDCFATDDETNQHFKLRELDWIQKKNCKTKKFRVKEEVVSVKMMDASTSTEKVITKDASVPNIVDDTESWILDDS